MSDEPSEDLKAFFARHQATGEPSATVLASVRARVLSASSRPVALRASRSWLRHEVMAVAAVLVVMVGAQGLYVLLRTPLTKDQASQVGKLPTPADDAVARADDAVARAESDVARADSATARADSATARADSNTARADSATARADNATARADSATARADDAVTQAQAAELDAVAAAYRSGDLEGALRLAAKGGPPCQALVPRLEQVSRLSPRLSTLSAAELAQLAAIDQQLGGGRPTALGQRVAQALPSGTSSAASLHVQARAALRAKDLEQAIALGEACTRADPRFADCHKLLGTAWAQRGTKDGDVRKLENARQEYERYLELAPADDEDVAKVRAILETERAAGAAASASDRRASAVSAQPDVDAGGTAAGTSEPARLVRQLRTARAAWQWGRAVTLANELLKLEPGNADALTILKEARMQAKDLYLRAYQLKESDPEEALKRFDEVVAMTPPDDDYHLKAQARSEELRGTR